MSWLKIVGCLALGLMASTLAVPASAQQVEPRFTVAFGAGQVRPLALDVRITAPTWSIAAQARATKHLILGAMASGWQHSLPQDSFQVGVNDGLLSTVTQGGRISMRSFGFGVLATAPFHRVRLSSGATIGYARVAEQVTFTVTQCGSTDPQSCQSSSHSGEVGGFAVQGLLGAGVRVTRRLEAFVVYALTLPATPGFATVSLMGGLRVSVR